jgi:glyoxylase-like metal-dependent hydrolase (beta-lactamase superfamily II)
LTERVTLLPGTDGGRYPYGNALLVRGRSETWLIDPSLDVEAGPPAGVHGILISHCHEDHLAGVCRYPGVPIHVHRQDRQGLDSLDGLMAIYGMPPEIDAAWRRELVEKFHYVPRPDAVSYDDGDAFDLGGITVRVIHLPGHTRGHCGFLIEPDGVMFLADVDLTRFGPYYGDAWSSLADFERSIARCREIEADTYVTFHHKGIVQGRATFLSLLDDYEAVIARRERSLLDFLAEPHSLDDIVTRRFVYRPHVTLLFTEAVERRSAELHLERLMASGAVVQPEPGRFVAATAGG